MSTIVTKAGKGGPLTHTEADANFTNLNSDKYESGSAASLISLVLTGLASQTESTALVINGSDTVGTRELSAGAFGVAAEDATITLQGGTNITTSIGAFTTNQSANETITINHATISTGATSPTGTLAYSGTFEAITGATISNGHVTNLETTTYTMPAGAVPDNGLLDINAGTEISLTIVGGDFTADKATETDITINHSNVTRTDPSAGSASLAHEDSFVAITGITSNARGHITGVQANTFTLPAEPSIYVHPDDGGGNQTALTGANVYSDIAINTLGHVTSTTTRALTPANIGAAPAGGSLVTNWLANEVRAATVVITDKVRAYSAGALVINAGESNDYATGQTAEAVYINAESGLTVTSSPDNWGSAWGGRKTAVINNPSGDSSFPGDVFAATFSESASVTTGGTYAVNASLASVHWRTLTASPTISFTGTPSTGNSRSITLVLQQDASGGRIPTWPTTNFYWADNVQPPASTGANDIDVYTIQIINKSGTLYYLASLSIKNAS